MSKAVDSAEILRVRDELTDFVDKISYAWSSDATITQLMEMRRYTEESMYNTLKEIGLFKCDSLSDLTYFVPDVTVEQMQEWGIIGANGEYILSGRYTVPIRDICNKVTALVGWFPDNRKYITTPTYGFTRDAQFFNIECYKDCVEKHNGVVYLVEGIFDTLSLRSLGFSALGNMGLQLSPIKTQILKRFGKVIAIPDNDRAGSGANPYCSKYDKSRKDTTWVIENSCVFVQLPKGVKDVDDFIKEFDCYDDLKSCEHARLVKKLKIAD